MQQECFTTEENMTDPIPFPSSDDSDGSDGSDSHSPIHSTAEPEHDDLNPLNHASNNHSHPTNTNSLSSQSTLSQNHAIHEVFIIIFIYIQIKTNKIN